MRTDSQTQPVNEDLNDESNEFLKQFMSLYADDIEEIIQLSEILQKNR